MINIFEDFFSIFGNGFDIIKVYDSMPVFFDFTIYLILFIGLTQTVFHKHFEDNRGGKAVIIALGIALSIGMSFIANQYGFSLKSFGPVAFIVLLVLVGIFIFKAVFKTGMNIGSTVSFAYVLVYLALYSITPAFFNSILTKVPFIRSVFAICLIIVCFKLIISVFKKDSVLGNNIKNLGIISPTFSDLKNNLAFDSGMEKSGIRDIREDKHISNAIIDDLSRLRALIDNYRINRTEETRSNVNNLIEDILKKENIALKKLDEIARNENRIESLDLGILKEFRQEYNRLPASAQRYIMKEIRDEKNKLNYEHESREIGSLIRMNEQNFRYCLHEIINSLKLLDFDKANSWIEKASLIKKQESNYLNSLAGLERKLMHLSSYSLKIIKRLLNRKNGR